MNKEGNKIPKSKITFSADIELIEKLDIIAEGYYEGNRSMAIVKILKDGLGGK